MTFMKQCRQSDSTHDTPDVQSAHMTSRTYRQANSIHDTGQTEIVRQHGIHDVQTAHRMYSQTAHMTSMTYRELESTQDIHDVQTAHMTFMKHRQHSRHPWCTVSTQDVQTGKQHA